MNITKKSIKMVLSRFKYGASMQEISDWYEIPLLKVERIVRDALESANERTRDPDA